jgi:hypothetical protein
MEQPNVDDNSLFLTPEIKELRQWLNNIEPAEVTDTMVTFLIILLTMFLIMSLKMLIT